MNDKKNNLLSRMADAVLIAKAEQVMEHPLLITVLNAETEKIAQMNRNAPQDGYVPPLSRLEELGSIQKDENLLIVSDYLRAISPFRSNVGKVQIAMIRFIRNIYGFSEDQILRMNLETKEHLIEIASASAKEAFRKMKSTLLNTKYEMFEDDYEVAKLKYLIENDGKEPKIYTEEDYLYIEAQLMDVFTQLSRCYFELDKTEEDTKKFKEAYVHEVFIHFLQKHLKRFFIHQDMLQYYLMPYWYSKLGEGLTDSDIKEYRELRISPLNVGIYTFTSLNFDNTESVQTLVWYSKYLRQLHQLLRKGDFRDVLFSYLSYAETAAMFYDQRVPFTKESTTQFILRHIPEVIEYLKKS